MAEAMPKWKLSVKEDVVEVINEINKVLFWERVKNEMIDICFICYN